MNEGQKLRNKQLAFLGVVFAEAFVTPTVLASIAYWLSRGKSYQPWAVFGCALVGLVIGFYRIYLVQKRFNQNDQPSK